VALESWTPDDSDGQVLVFVNRGFHDPELYFTDSGDISIIADESEPMVAKFGVKKGEEKVEKKGLFSELFAGNITAGSIEVSKVTIGGKSLEEFLSSINTTASSSAVASASDSAVILNEVKDLKDSSLKAQNDILDLKSQMASLSARFASIETLAGQAGETNGLLEKLLNSPLLSASTSAISTQQSGTVESLEVGESLTVLGRTTLSDLGVTGNITAGILSINGLEGTINSIGEPLRLQNLSVAGIDILDGKVTIDINGNIKAAGKITAPEIETKKLFIQTTDVAGATIGTGVIETGETTVTIPAVTITAKSKVFVTATSLTGKQPLIVSRKDPGKSFTVKIEQPINSEITFDWWIVN
jgi:hypothetical protein